MANMYDLENEIRMNQADADVTPTQDELENNPELQYLLQMRIKEQLAQQREVERMRMLQQRQNPVGSDSYFESLDPKNIQRGQDLSPYVGYDVYDLLGN